MSTKRITERAVASALEAACRVFDLPCAYDGDGRPLSPYSDAKALRGDDGMGAHIVDYQPAYGGVRIQRYPGDGGGGHCRAHAVFTANGLPSGVDGRASLREVHDVLLRLTVNAYRAQAEATPDDLDAVRGARA